MPSEESGSPGSSLNMGPSTLNDIQTPALLVNLNVLDHNLEAMERCLAGHSAKLRPHFKNHTVIALARRQMQNGAIGMTVARLRHAELLLSHGITSVLVSNEIVTASEIRWLIDLAARFGAAGGEVIAIVDNAAVAREMGRLASEARVAVSVLVDIDLGLKRTGVSPVDAPALAETVRDSGLRLRGVMGYEGHLQKLLPEENKAAISQETTGLLLEAFRAIRRLGIPLEIVSTAGTGTFEYAAQWPEVTELQAGSYLLMETAYEAAAPRFKSALSVLATVISKHGSDRAIVDAGLKAMSGERGLPVLKEWPGVELRAIHAEHGILNITNPSAPVHVGDRIQLPVYYSDGTVNLHRQMYGIRNGQLEEIFKIEG